MAVSFDELPFNARPDLTPYLLHLTKNTKAEDKFSAYENLVSILMTGKIFGSSTKKGFIKGKTKAACFMDVPFASLKHVLTPENRAPKNPRYEPYGIVVTKRNAYRDGCRPVLYLSNQESAALKIPERELWRVVRLEVVEKKWISWLHEREWRCPRGFQLPAKIPAVFVRNSFEAEELADELAKAPKDFKCRPRSIIPLNLLCQGFLK